MNGKFAWHVHHNTLVEPLTGPLEGRWAFIREHKPPEEQDLRLRLCQEVKGELPAQVIEAGAVLYKAWAAYKEDEASLDEALATYFKAGAALDKAETAYKEAEAENMSAILVLHAQECPDCPWDGMTIFPRKEKP